MNCLTTNALWRLEHVPTTISFIFFLSISTLNNHSLEAHIEDVIQDEDL